MRFSTLYRLLTAIVIAILFASLCQDIYGREKRHEAEKKDNSDNSDKPVQIDVLTPKNGDSVGFEGIGWVIDLRLRFKTDIEATGFSGFQLTGPAGHNDIPPFPGLFAPGADEKVPGLIVVLSTQSSLGLNLAGLFNLTGIANMDKDEVEIWDTWIIGAPVFGVGVPSTLYVAVADDIDGNGVFDDAPDQVPDSDGDGDIDHKDLMDFGVASRVAKVKFFINE